MPYGDPARQAVQRFATREDIEDGTTSTHGGMAYGAGYMAATRAQAAEIVDPRPYAAPRIAAVYTAYRHLGAVLPAMGYGAEQLADLAQTIDATRAEVVVSATPIVHPFAMREALHLLRQKVLWLCSAIQIVRFSAVTGFVVSLWVGLFHLGRCACNSRTCASSSCMRLSNCSVKASAFASRSKSWRRRDAMRVSVR
jgi:hypothetical protein